MNVIIASHWVWSCEMPSQIFVKRLARAFHACGHTVIGIQSEHNYLPEEEWGFYKYPWGDCCTVPDGQVTSTLDQILEHIPKPDLLIVANTINQDYYDLAKKYDIVIAPFQSDPFYLSLPPKSHIEAMYGQADLVFCNEGHATNWINECLPEKKAHTINHALDLTIAPTDEDIKNLKKEYLASIVAGLEVRRHGELMRLFYIPSLSFSGQRFGVAGSLSKRFPRSVMEDENSSCSEEEIEKYSDFTFENVFPVSEPIKNPMAGSQAGVVHWDEKSKSYKPWFGGGLSWENAHKLYAQSFFGVDPFGGYLTNSPYAKGTKGTKIYEIMGSGSVPICNHIAGMEDLITDGKTGFYCETVEDARKALQYGVDNPDEVQNYMGKKARKLIMKKHKWTDRVKQIEKIISSL